MPIPLDNFLLVFVRLTGLFLSAPIFASRQLPGQVKVLMITVLAAFMAMIIKPEYAAAITTPGMMIAALVVELLIGYTLGFIAYLFISSVQLAGQLMDMQLGFAMVNVVDPMSGMQAPLMGNFGYLLALLSYLSMNGHHYLLEALAESYRFIPVLGFAVDGSFIALLLEMSAIMFVLAVKLSAPVVLAVMISDVSLGFIARTVPQMNVFVVGMPLKIIVGMFILFMVLPMFIWFTGYIAGYTFDYIDTFLKIMLY